MDGRNFIIRVYGIYLATGKGLLVSDEIVKGKYVTKFPGGGLEYGEGTIACLKREMMEETGCEFRVVSHYYTTDFFVESAFHPSHQVLSIYYLIEPVNSFEVKIAATPFEFNGGTEGSQSFRFVPFDKISASDFSFPIDQFVVNRLKEDVA